MKLFSAIILLILAHSVSYGQCGDGSGMSELKVYSDLDQATLNPLEVLHQDLSKQKLKIFPSDIFLMKNLQVLILDKNKLKVIPEQIGELSCLRVFSAEGNKLTEISNGIYRLKSLEELNLGDNQIGAITDQIGRLKELKKLILWSNVIGEYSYSLRELTKLEILDLLNNQMSKTEQDLVTSFLPNAEIILSPPCNCEFK